MGRPGRLLVAVDFSKHSDRAAEAALKIGEHYGAEIHFVHALELPLPIFEPYAVSVPASFVADARKSASDKLEKIVQRAKSRGLESTSFLGEVPAPAAIAERAREIKANLVVVGTRGHTGLKHMLLGSVAERTVHEAACSVLTVKGDGEPAVPPRTIAVGVDFSEGSDRALEVATDVALEFRAPLHLVHALDLHIPFVTPYEVSVPDAFIESAREAAMRRLEGLVERATRRGAEAHLHLASAPPASALAEGGEQIGADLIVTGSRGLSGLKHAVLGSVAERTLRHAHCSVLTVKLPTA